MESRLTGKRALVILTNEAFLPRTGKGGRHPNVADGMPSSGSQTGPQVLVSPAAWTNPQPAIHDPPASYSAIKDSEESFARSHERTGVDVFELGYLWITLKRQYNIELTFATPRGGPVAADPTSMERVEKDARLRDHLLGEREFIIKMGHTLPISWIKPADYELVIVPGGHGAMFDLPQHDDVATVITQIYAKGGYIATIGHGAAALLNIHGCSQRQRAAGDYFVKDARLTCFSNAEEEQLRLKDFLPYLLEDCLRERGAKLEIKKPGEPCVVVFERLITAQSAPSIQEFVKKITEALGGK